MRVDGRVYWFSVTCSCALYDSEDAPSYQVLLDALSSWTMYTHDPWRVAWPCALNRCIL